MGMSPGAQKMRDFYEMKKDAHIYQEEFGFFTFDRWQAEGFRSKIICITAKECWNMRNEFTRTIYNLL